MLNLCNADTQIIPGHGPLATCEDLSNAIEMLKATRAAVKRLVDKGMNLEGVKAAKPLAAYDEQYAWAFITGEVFTTILFNDLAQ